ncbi:LEAF RUST 10 DISEASE-RESISTANCE LOCUS RECEPTOR-LIKE PROTEIN KINASE-like 2.4 isoform X1 [Trifolium pratense]|uniref:LEAF RUST 10 DISEASE-RESISTANCE LOCUS RECEPTOR-LIKE PROTEIN KINASE-like 2.4 isoform X1 n=1 Tax=Trifolium pratense TaxID=57577 RepID=UPI001E6902FA|nr:LEAF RUST 10 DISEASE-RESISTANCE LOCUS RECEPTOR-LIKE PROTEIN KINASE-like 2.4 isoform X1 [Trifolium pratense]
MMASVNLEFLLLLFSQLILLHVLAGGDENKYQGECLASFSCGYLGNISFPFTTTERPDCGLLPIHNCDDDDPQKPKSIQLQKEGKWFEVEVGNPLEFHGRGSSTFVFRDDKLYKLLQTKSCEAFRYNYTLPSTSGFASFRIKTNATLFVCNHTLQVHPPTYMLMHNYTKCPQYDLFYQPYIIADNVFRSAFTDCTIVHLPTKDIADGEDPFTFVTADISIEVKITEECAYCHFNLTGQCQLDSNGRFYCANGILKQTPWKHKAHINALHHIFLFTTLSSYVKSELFPLTAAVTVSKRKGLSQNVKLGLAMVAIGFGVAVLMLLAYCIRTKIFSSTFLLFRKENPTHQIIEQFLKEHGPLPAARYSYLDVKKITNSFKNKLGQGGYGSVYKGKLHDERTVAVKVLSESKGDGEDFINEVASISRTSHVNVVRLLGFCLDGSKKALLYEFMPNGSLEKFIYEEKDPLKNDRQLDCKLLYDIAVGVARGLEYLHRGCNTRILHFDIKPHNILLDDDFCPKISDFGLAKICPRKESIVSIFGARGTPGYIAPELFSRNFGGVSHKSDVYSYGMMVLEMVGQKKNIKVEVDCSSELYFPHWIYKRLELNQDFGLRCIKNEIDEEMVRKMTVVSLWCIQTDPSHRPAMHKVVEMLEGGLQVLEIPPKPFMSSPSTSSIHLSSEIL